MHNFIHVNNYVLKAEHTPDLDAVVVAKLRASAGLVYLDQKEYAKVRERRRLGKKFRESVEIVGGRGGGREARIGYE